MKNFDTNRMLRWRLIFEEYGPAIEYIQGEKNIAGDALSQLPNNGNQETTHETMYKTENMSEFTTSKNFLKVRFLYLLTS